MSRASLMADLQPFVGQKIINCADKINSVATGHRYSVNIIDPLFNPGSIDNDENRLNVRTDKDGKVLSYSIG